MPGCTQPPATRKQCFIEANLEKTKQSTFSYKILLALQLMDTLQSVLVLSPHLILASVLQNLCAQVAAFDGTQVLLVAFAIAGILVQHVGSARLCL